MLSLKFVTQSEGKVREAEAILGFKLDRFNIDLPEIQSVSVEKVVVQKAILAFETLHRQTSIEDGQGVLVEDTGLYIEAWGGLPGALIKWFIHHPKPDGICKMLSTFTNKKAYAESIVATYDGQLHLFHGQVSGEISQEPKGTGGFGWDTIFIPTGETRTFGQMSMEEKLNFSMRRKAFEQMKAFYSPIIDE